MKKKIFTSIFALMLGISFASGQFKGSPGTKIDVWDFGAEALDTAAYVNRLDSATINSWYLSSITPGTSGVNFPSSFTAGNLSWASDGTNDRLRTTNTKLTRYDANIASVVGYTGRVYVNSAAKPGRYMALTLGEDDEVTIVEKTDAGGKINFVYYDDPAAQTNVVDVTSNLDTLYFVANSAGTYRIYDTQGKPSYFRIYRKDATYVTIKGTVDITQAAGIPGGYGVNLKNNAGKTWNAIVSSDTFSIQVPAGYNYALSLSGANGYIISNGKTLQVTEATTSYNIEILKAELFAVSGSITGLDAATLSKLSLVYTSDTAAHKIYVPEPVVNPGAASYTVQLEANCKYRISALGVNDYFVVNDSVTIAPADSIIEVAFAAKQVNDVTINVTGLSAEQLAKLQLIFSNLKEPGYSYSFSATGAIALRDGTYALDYSGLDEYPVQLDLTSNLKVAGADATKTLAFSPVTTWTFDDKAIVSGKYKGLVFTGVVTNDLLKGNIGAKPGATILIPVSAGDKTKVTFYNSAAFTISDSDTFRTSSGSTSTLEFAEHIYSGTVDGFDTIKVLTGPTTTYFTEISIIKTIAYRPVVYVGTDKEYKTINDALADVNRMLRGNTDRVTVMIDPGNYEEMLVVSSANVTLKNAAANPSIALANKGVDIDANAVRITSYYGHGYNYYSMGTNQKWNAEILSVNKENGSLSYANIGSGTTNGSYWNATVVISANGFEAENIIFENSFNQYISKKESEDVVVMWEVGNKGLRPTNMGNTGVQKRSFVERAAAIAITNNTDKVVLTKCRVVSRQDALYGGTGARVVFYKGAVLGAVDYIFGPMTAVFYKTDLVMNVSDGPSDAAYLVAPQQTGGRGYLMYKCSVKAATPGIETESAFHAKPGFFGRPWQSVTSEAVFFNTTINTTDYTGFEGKSLISPEGWSNTLSGESNLMYEYGTFEKSGENNLASRVPWSTVLTEPTLTDGTAITTFNFTKGSDDWDPIPVETDELTVSENTWTIASPANNAAFDIISNVGWTVASDQTWLTVSNSSGSDTATISLSATANTTVNTRTAIVTVSGNGVTAQTITVTQYGVLAVLTVSSDALAVTANDNSTVTFDITSNTNWTVVSNQSWLAVSNATGSGNATITLTAEANPTMSERVATITVAGTGVTSLTIIVTQDPGETGIAEVGGKSLSVFPNPVVNELSISNIHKNASISIYNLVGNLMISRTAETTIEKIDVSNLRSGIYLIKVTESKTIWTQTFTKQ